MLKWIIQATSVANHVYCLIVVNTIHLLESDVLYYLTEYLPSPAPVSPKYARTYRDTPVAKGPGGCSRYST